MLYVNHLKDSQSGSQNKTQLYITYNKLTLT